VEQSDLLDDDILVSETEEHYFQDSKLTFEDEILLTCDVYLTLEELHEFCDNKDKELWRNLMIFENLKNIKKVGKFGNSNAEFM